MIPDNLKPIDSNKCPFCELLLIDVDTSLICDKCLYIFLEDFNVSFLLGKYTVTVYNPILKKSRINITNMNASNENLVFKGESFFDNFDWKSINAEEKLDLFLFYQ